MNRLWLLIILAMLSLTVASAAGGRSLVIGDMEIENRTYVIAGEPSTTSSYFLKWYRPTFETYLNEYFANMFDGIVKFELQAVDLTHVVDKVKKKEVDFLFVNPSAFSCLELGEGVTALATLSSIDHDGNFIDGISGTIIVRKDDNRFSDLSDLEGKTVGASSLLSLTGGQVQAQSMTELGLSLVQDPQQLIFYGNDQAAIVQKLLSGEIDAACVKSELIESLEDEGIIPMGSVRYLGTSDVSEFHGNPYYYPHVGRIYPAWPFAALSSIPHDLKEAVAKAFYDMPEKHPAAVAAHYNEWVWPLPYSTVRNLQENLDVTFVNETTGQVRCRDSSREYYLIKCPEGFFRLPQSLTKKSCGIKDLECPVGATCFCKPCKSGTPVVVLPESPTKVLQMESYTNISRICDKMHTCMTSGLYPGQGAIHTYTVVNFLEMDQPSNITFVLHLSGEKLKTIQCVDFTEAGWCSVNITTTEVGDHMFEVLLNGKSIESSPLFMSVLPRICPELQQATFEGECECSPGNIMMMGRCQQLGTIIPIIAAPIGGVLVILIGMWYLLPKIGVDKDMVFAAMLWPFKVLVMTFVMIFCALLIVSGLAGGSDQGGGEHIVNTRKQESKSTKERAHDVAVYLYECTTSALHALFQCITCAPIRARCCQPKEDSGDENIEKGRRHEKGIHHDDQSSGMHLNEVSVEGDYEFNKKFQNGDATPHKGLSLPTSPKGPGAVETEISLDLQATPLPAVPIEVDDSRTNGKVSARHR